MTTSTKRPDGGELKSNADYRAGLERAAKYHDDAARDCDAIAAVNQDNDLGPDCITAAADHRIAADEIRLLKATPQAKRPVAFRVPRTDPRAAGETLGMEYRLFTDEEAARDEAEALGVEYQGLYVRDGAKDERP